MKVRRPFLAIMITIFLLSSTVVFGAYNMQYRTIIQLSADQNTVTSTGYAGNFGEGFLSVIYGSAGDAELILQYSTGSSWQTVTSITVSPGSSDSTGIWGLGSVDFLYRIKVQSNPFVFDSNPGRIAYGTLYTGFEG